MTCDNNTQSYASMQHSPSVLPTPFSVVASPSCKISTPPDASLLHHSFVPPSSSAVMEKIKYQYTQNLFNINLRNIASGSNQPHKFPNLSRVRKHSTFQCKFDTNYCWRYGMNDDESCFHSRYSEINTHYISTPTRPDFRQTQPFNQQVLQEISQTWKQNTGEHLG